LSGKNKRDLMSRNIKELSTKFTSNRPTNDNTKARNSPNMSPDDSKKNSPKQ